MVADKGKKAKVAPEEEALVVDDALLLSIEKLQEVQDDLEKINEEASDEVLELEQKYSVVRRPIYVKRNDVIKTIPDFWLTAFMSHPALCDVLNEEDGKIFKYLESLDVADFKDLKLGYSITFNFNENPYFEDAKLIKTFRYSEDGTTSTTGTNIKWKKNMAAAVNGVASEKNGKKRSHESQSFFSWFNETEQKDLVDLQDEVGEIIKEDLWPNPLKYFNDAGGDYDEDNEDEDDDDNDSNDEQDDNEEDSADDDDEPEE